MFVCPTAFKETLSAASVASAIVRGLRTLPAPVELDIAPLSDGGDGLLEALATHDPALESREVAARDPLRRPISARFLASAGRSVIETARAAGLSLLTPAERDPLRTSTEGVGDLLAAAGSGSIVLGLGGSATVDGGVGMARALGWRFLDSRGRPISPGGGALRSLARIVPRAAAEHRPESDAHGSEAAASAGHPITPRAPGVVQALADVRTPLTGPEGAARVFAPQKGADPDAVTRLEEGLATLALRIRDDLGIDVSELAGGGAAGGLGAGSVAFLGADLTGGAEWVLQAISFDARLADADFVVTGEGSWDGQSGLGKIVGVVVDRCVTRGVPVVVVAGRAEEAAADRSARVIVRAGDGRTLGAEDIGGLAAQGVRAALAG